MPSYPPLRKAPLIVCEGKDDEGFLWELIEKRDLPDFNVLSPNKGFGGGIDAIDELLKGIGTLTGFSTNVKTVVIVADADDNPPKNFTKIQKFIESRNIGKKANKVWPVPTAVGELAVGIPNVVVRLLPENNAGGALESLIWRNVCKISENEKIECVEAAVSCSGATKWSKQKADKARLRTYISITHKSNPNCGVGMIWKQKPPLVDIMEATFDDFATFLKSIADEDAKN